MKLALTERRMVAQDAMAFWLQPERPLSFVPGQFGEFALTDPAGLAPQDSARLFSFASAPGAERIMIATRMRDSGFKRRLREMPLGGTLRLTGPLGAFGQHTDEARPAVFLAGGIGVTPVRSIVEDAIARGVGRPIAVFHANRTRARTPFLEDFLAWNRAHENIAYTPTLTGEEPDDPRFEFGPIGMRLLARHLPNLHEPTYYVVGPPAMAEAARRMLAEVGVYGSQIRSEDFTGY